MPISKKEWITESVSLSRLEALLARDCQSVSSIESEPDPNLLSVPNLRARVHLRLFSLKRLRQEVERLVTLKRGEVDGFELQTLMERFQLDISSFKSTMRSEYDACEEEEQALTKEVSAHLETTLLSELSICAEHNLQIEQMHEQFSKWETDADVDFEVNEPRPRRRPDRGNIYFRPAATWEMSSSV